MRPVSSLAMALWLLAGAAPGSASSSSLEVHLRLAEDGARATASSEPVTATLTFTDMKDEAFSQKTTVPGSAVFHVDPDATYRLSVSAPGLWLPEQIVRPDPTKGKEDVVLALFPTGVVHGRVEVEQDEELPEELLLRFAPTPDTETAVPEGTLHCPVGEDAELACDVPAGTLDLRLRARQFITHSRWGLEIEAGRETNLGTLELVRGASVVGWLEPPTQDFRYDRVEVRLAPQKAAYGSPTDRLRQDRLVQEVSVNDRGYFELPGVAPGSYELEVTHPGYAPTRLSPVRVLRNAETEVRSLTLAPPVTLTVHVEPPRHPYRIPWKVELWKRSAVPGNADFVTEGPTSESGRFRATDLEPGDYQLEVTDGHDATWFHEDVQLGSESRELTVTLPILRVEGTVTLGDEPLAATVHFGGRHGAQRISVDSDEAGKFYVFLPEQKSWLVDVVNPGESVYHRIEDLELQGDLQDRKAEARIEIPDTTLRGTAVDELDRPLPGAHVRAVGVTTVETDSPDGRFEIRGLSPGRVRLEAEYYRPGESLFAESVELHLADGETREDVRLVLRPQKEVNGQVVDGQGRGVLGATVLAMLVQDDRLLTSAIRDAVTDVDGVFRMRLPAATRDLTLNVLPPGFAATQAPVTFDGDEDEKTVIVPVDPVGGTVTLTRSLGQEDHSLHLYHRGILAVPYLRRWARLHGEERTPTRLAIPMLEPGEYTACVLPDYSWWSHPPADADDLCASGTLTPYGELVLDLSAASDRDRESDRVANSLGHSAPHP